MNLGKPTSNSNSSKRAGGGEGPFEKNVVILL